MKKILILFLLSINVSFAQQVPELLSEQNLKSTITKKYRMWASGYTIYDFRVNTNGKVDSLITTEHYFIHEKQKYEEEDALQNQNNIKALEFKPLEKPVWVQYKIYTNFYRDDVTRYLNADIIDRLRAFDYRFSPLVQNEIKTHFTDKNNKFLDYIIINEKIIFAPVVMNGTI